MRIKPVFALLFTLSIMLYVCPANSQNLLSNGDFQTDANGDGWPDEWERGQGIATAREGDNVWLVFESGTNLTRTIPIDPKWWMLKVSCRMRVNGIVLGKEGWQDGRLTMDFQDAAGKHLDPWPNVFHAEGTTDWVANEREYTIPKGAVKLAIGPAQLGIKGQLEIDDIAVSVSRPWPEKEDLPVPQGIDNLWDLSKAWRESSPTRESVCLNDLWAFKPLLESDGDALPAKETGWGWFKVPGIWPGGGGAAQEILLAPVPSTQFAELSKIDRAWYQRELEVPANWSGRRIALDFTMVQTHARVLLDGEEAGQVWFPGGELDITKWAKPGTKQVLSILLTARPLATEAEVFMAPDRIIRSRAEVRMKGLTGDVYLHSRPMQDALGDVQVITSTRKKTIALDLRLNDLGAGKRKLAAKVLERGEAVKEFASDWLSAGDLKNGRFEFAADWADPKLWEVDTPQQMYEVVVTLSDELGKVLDQSLPTRFGFREFWIDGRDFYLNGHPVRLRSIFLETLGAQANLACLETCRNTCQRLKEYGFNFFITGNYDFAPGNVGYLDALFQASDEEGVLCSLSLPHVKDFEYNLDDPKQRARYEKLAEWLVRRAQNHPSIVLYAMNHNMTGYTGDQNPLKIDGIYSPDKSGQPSNIRKQALKAAEIAGRFDSSRPIYHHQSGNLGTAHTVNIYLNWAPLQERSDWLEHWATVGVKPFFAVEWGLPHISSWSSYRGPEFIWTSKALQQVWDSEYAAAYIGQEAYRMTPRKVESMKLEEELWAKGEPFYWSTLIRFLQGTEENYLQIQSLFAADNWRSHRAWGASALLPWDQGGFWRRKGESKEEENPDRNKGLQQPGIVPDRFMPGDQYIYDRGGNFEPTSLGKTFLRWNMPLCAYIGGGPERFTEKGHTFLPGETVSKQLVILNDGPRAAACEYSWRLSPGGQSGQGKLDVAPGGKQLVPVSIRLPEAIASGAYTLSASFKFGDDVTQEDSFRLDVLPSPPACSVKSKVALFDPKGMTKRVLDDLGVSYTAVDSSSSLTAFDMLVIGREGLGSGQKCPDLSAVANGLKVLVFEQQPDVLEQLGFRINIHGLRQVFVRAASHPALKGLGEEHLRNWRGASTLTPPYLTTDDVESRDPSWVWQGFENTRVWRSGNHGNVFSVLIEKPDKGNFLPILDGGFDLQYSPLLESIEGQGRIILCQLDVTGRTEADPAARAICANLLEYLDTAAAVPARRVVYAGGEQGASLLKELGIAFEKLGSHPLDAQTLLVVAPGAETLPGLHASLQEGLNLLALGLDGEPLRQLLEQELGVKRQPTVPSLVKRFDDPALAGLSNAELHWRTLLELPAFEQLSDASNEGLRVMSVGKGKAVLCQAAPWMFDCKAKPYLRTTYRRNTFLVSRLLGNLGAQAAAPLAGRLRELAESAPAYAYHLPTTWKGLVDRQDAGRNAGWFRPDFDDQAWPSIRVPGVFNEQRPELADYIGVFWYRLTFTVPKNLATTKTTLYLGAIDDESWVWLNGEFLGEVTGKTNPSDSYSFPRQYEILSSMLKRGGKNVIAVRDSNLAGGGGMLGEPRLSVSRPQLETFYLQQPEAVDDPYRYYRW